MKPAPKRKTVVVTEKVQQSSTVKTRANKPKPVRQATVRSSRERDDEGHEREHESEHEYEHEYEREDDD